MSRPKKAIAHGTVNGYAAHKRRKEPACAACLKAWSAYYRDCREQGKGDQR